jgi:hypothetical protein
MLLFLHLVAHLKGVVLVKTFKKLIILIIVVIFLLPIISACSHKTKEVYISLVPTSFSDVGGDAFNYKVNDVWVTNYPSGLNSFSDEITVEVFQVIPGVSKKIMTVYIKLEELENGDCISYIYEILGPSDKRTQKITITIQNSNFGERKIASVTI